MLARARWALLFALLAAAPAAACVGDCDGDGTVAIAELLAGVRSALGDQPVSACAAADVDGDGRIDIGELVQAVSAALGGCVVTPSPTPTARPNVLLVVLDDSRADGLDRMPTVQDLAARGVSFRNAFVTNSVCCPSRATILTGLYPIHHGTRALTGDFGGADNFRQSGADQQTLAVWLHDAGYITGLFGKYLNDYSGSEAVQGPNGGFYIPPGWDRWRAYVSPEAYGGVSGGTYQLVDEAGTVTTYDDHQTDAQYSTDVLGASLRQFLGEAADRRQPFLAVYTPHASHADVVPIPAVRHQGLFSDLPLWRPPNWDEADISDKPHWLPLQPVDPFDGRFTDASRRLAYQSLMAVDEQLAAVRDLLAARSLADNTVVLVTSDNGVMWGEHRLPMQVKENPYEEALRVPLIVYDPRHPEGAGVRGQPALNLDLAPTIAALAGVQPPVAVDGATLTPLLAGDDVRARDDFLIDHTRVIRIDQLTYAGRPRDGDRVRLLYGSTRQRPRPSVLYEFDSGDGVAAGAQAVPIAATAADTFVALGTAIAATVPQVEVAPLLPYRTLAVGDVGAAHDGVIFRIENDQGGVMTPSYPIPDYVGVRDVANGFTYVEYETEEVELYDLTADPWQLDNRADDPAYAGIRATLAARLRELLGEAP